MPEIKIDKEKCKSCGLCINACPRNCIKFSNEVNNAGYRWVAFDNEKGCIGCGFCYQVCPDICIEVYK